MIGYRHAENTVVESVKGRGRGRPKKTWRQCVDEDMAKLYLSVMDSHDRALWRNGILETVQPCCSADN